MSGSNSLVISVSAGVSSGTLETMAHMCTHPRLAGISQDNAKDNAACTLAIAADDIGEIL